MRFMIFLDETLIDVQEYEEGAFSVAFRLAEMYEDEAAVIKIWDSETLETIFEKDCAEG